MIVFHAKRLCFVLWHETSVKLIFNFVKCYTNLLSTLCSVLCLWQPTMTFVVYEMRRLPPALTSRQLLSCHAQRAPHQFRTRKKLDRLYSLDQHISYHPFTANIPACSLRKTTNVAHSVSKYNGKFPRDMEWALRQTIRAMSFFH